MRFMRGSLLIAFVGSLFASLGAQERPNILWIFSEDLSPYMGCYDDPINKGHTPAIDQFAKDGVLFKRAYMPAPVCSACRSAMITGVYQTTTGTHQHRSSRGPDGKVVPEEDRIHLPEGMKTVPELFREAGYFTFNAGKDDYNFHYDRRALYSVGTSAKYGVGMNGWQGNKADPINTFTEHTWTDCPDGDPWFGQIMIWGGKANARHVRKGEKLAKDEVPLPPYFPKAPGLQAAWTAHYNAARGADRQVEEILAQLKKDGQLENTIVFFFSDHGNNQSLRHKQFCYEGGVHVPLMVQGEHPALKAGTVRDELVLGLDISATTLALAGIAVPDYFHGRDLFANGHEPRDYVVSARDRCDYTIDRIRTVRTEKYRYLRNYYPERTLLQPQYRDDSPAVKDLKRLHQEGKLTAYQEKHWFGVRPEEELYDLSADPHQINNLADDPEFAAELKWHREILDDWIKETGDKGEQPESAKSLRPTYELWKNQPIFKNAVVNPEYLQFLEKHEQ
ncbi:sulfatase family protein [Roseibacillus persicicus]|uniref:sulfatase family protein n=1 Tax=Roseibacillus persicicus TaxID=454148 RepID=UPI00280CE3E8|nr:sulfatase [Roseibacillus persicicus]MDQ8192585.1 sulfatase [Roseibacillus persicicus]